VPKVNVIVVDRTRSPFLRKAEAAYLERLRKYITTGWVEIKPAKIREGHPDEEVLSVEGDRILKKIKPQDYAIALDRRGKALDSKKFAARVASLLAGPESMFFIVGGPLGLSEKVLSAAQDRMSLSRLTFTHEMSRLILLEQLYRAFTIIRGHRYHR
jgi:23S rRNA (pseudouridine1915-N3)-methyltransferase